MTEQGRVRTDPGPARTARQGNLIEGACHEIYYLYSMQIALPAQPLGPQGTRLGHRGGKVKFPGRSPGARVCRGNLRVVDCPDCAALSLSAGVTPSL